MIVIYMVVSIIGGLVTASIIGTQSLWLGLLAAPFGGSLLVAAAAAAIFLMESRASYPETQAIPPGVVWG